MKWGKWFPTFKREKKKFRSMIKAFNSEESKTTSWKGLYNMNKSSRQNIPLRLTVSITGEKNSTFTWCNHDFVFLGADPQEREVILGIDVPHGAPRLHDEAVHEARVLNSRGVVHSAFDRNTCKTGDSKGQRQNCRTNSALGSTRSNRGSYLTSADVVTTPGVIFKGLNEEHKQKYDVERLRSGTAGVGESCLTSSSISALILLFHLTVYLWNL